MPSGKAIFDVLIQKQQVDMFAAFLGKQWYDNKVRANLSKFTTPYIIYMVLSKIEKERKERMVDALAQGGEEGRGKLR